MLKGKKNNHLENVIAFVSNRRGIVIKSIIFLIALICVMMILRNVSNATSLNTSPSLHYTPILSGYDSNNSYYFVQNSVTWQNLPSGSWPSNEGIFYAPFTQDYTQSGDVVYLWYTGETSVTRNYYSGRGYKSNYRVGAYTSGTSSVDTNFSFYV